MRMNDFAHLENKHERLATGTAWKKEAAVHGSVYLIRSGSNYLIAVELIVWYEEDRVELFHLASDLGEQTDREPQRVAQLRGELHAWQKQVGARFPIPNPDYDPAKPSGRAATRPATQGK